MALSTKGVTLKYGTSQATTAIVIKSFPEMFGRMMTAETTTLSDSAQTFIETIREVPSVLEFNANFDKTVFSTINGLTAKQRCELSFSDGSKIAWEGTLSAVINAGSVGEVLEMTICCVPGTIPTFTAGT